MSNGKVILVADDDGKIRTFIWKILREEGYEVLAAADGSEALEQSKHYAGVIDLLLTDVDMPRMDGVTACRCILTDRTNMKVLFMSGSTMQSPLSELWPFLSKPFQLDDLLTKVSDILEDSTEAKSSTTR